ncbi:hypothetical protein [Synechococcus sp. CBW1108]|uniref:hypothetical protein n=1 Tax=Synechococcus sp. CBW1108 TaxID=1353147 RepID=UPI0018CDD8B6|nr:hypothetical protein [Synechococcus sp. CBW1108]QPN69372.1 hypothetical protein H8F27_12385 [Synechococcus sp. CBW1108]
MAAAGRRSLVLVAGFLLLAGCSGTPFGDQLAGSFSAPPAPAPTPAPSSPKPPPPATATKTPASKGPDPKARPAAPQAPSPSNTSPSNTSPTNPAPSKPAPYRITIQLPAADPAAPAEAVTEALRAAGLRFEVEMIERIGSPAAPAAAPTVSPAPAPR